MATPKATVTQAELRRYLRAMREAGFDGGRVEIAKPDGTRVAVVVGKAGEGVVEDADEIDRIIEKIPNAIPKRIPRRDRIRGHVVPRTRHGARGIALCRGGELGLARRF